MGPSSQYSLPTMDRWFFLRAKRLALKPAWAPASKEEAFATELHGKSELEAWATVCKEKAFATDEHGITRKREANKPKEIHLPRTNTELHGIRREIRAGCVSDGRQRRSICDGITRNKKWKNPVRHFRECGNPYLQQGKNGPPHTRGWLRRRIRRINHSHREDAKSAK